MGETKTSKLFYYRDPSTESLLVKLHEENINLDPIFDLTYGFRYMQAEKILEKDPAKTRVHMEELAEAGILSRSPFEKSLQCPSCGSTNVSTQYSCPHDGSTDIDRDALLEHFACGHIDTRTNFQMDNELVCPQCRETLISGSYRTVGSWNQCHTCNRRLDVISTNHRCRECNTDFTYDDARIDAIYIYSLSEETIVDINSGIYFISQLRDVLKKFGYSFKQPPTLKGTSGIDYEFDMIAVDQNNNFIPINVIISENPIKKEILMEEYGKFLDNRKESFLVLIPPLTGDVRMFADTLEIKIIQASSPTDALNSLTQQFSSMVSDIPQAVEDSGPSIIQRFLDFLRSLNPSKYLKR